MIKSNHIFDMGMLLLLGRDVSMSAYKYRYAGWIGVRNIREVLDKSPSGEWRASEHTYFPYDEGCSVYQAPDDGGHGHERRVAWADNAAIGAAIALAHNVLPLAINAFEAVRKVHDRDHRISTMLGAACPSCEVWQAILDTLVPEDSLKDVP